jgi:hypothetical protein
MRQFLFDPTISWLTARASRLSFRPKPRMCECAPESKEEGNSSGIDNVSIHSIRVISQTC